MPPSAESGLTRAALEVLYRDLERPLYNVVLRWVWNREEALDIVQDAFVRLWQRRAEVRLESVRPLAFKIALNLAANRRRWARVRSFARALAPGEAAVRAPAGDDGADEQRLATMRSVLASLPDALKSVVVLCELSELSYAEVAAALGISVGTVGSRRNRALKRLRAGIGAIEQEASR